jgi:hypothetical protein
MSIINDIPKEFGATDFLIEIEKMRVDRNVTLMDAVIHYCEKHNVEIESVAQYMKKNLVLKSELQEEAEELNYLQKTARLPI